MFKYCKMSVVRQLIVILVTVSTVRSAKILGIFYIPSVSHQVVFQPIWRELSLRGHEVTIMSPNPLRDPSLTNLTEIDLSYLYENISVVNADMAKGLNHWETLNLIFDNRMTQVVEDVFKSSHVGRLINDTSKEFDVVLAEYIIPVMGIFASRFNCPLIGVAPLNAVTNTLESAGVPVHPTLYPDVLTTFGEDMTFLEKVDAFLYMLWSKYYYYNVGLPTYDRLLNKFFSTELPRLQDIEKNVSILFLNTNPIIHKPRPYPPGVIELGRMHIKPKKILPQELQKYLDDAVEGVIYFSFGSNIKSSNLDAVKRSIIRNTLAMLPYKILWKFEHENMPEKPENVMISKWLPQQDILGHPNIKLFITQGGLQSLEEAILNKVPLLAIPFMFDQYANAKRITKLGIGLDLQYNKLSSSEFKAAILEVVQNSKYKHKISEIANLLVDQPMTGLEKAVWWTEYVIRHRGAPYFKIAAVDTPWHEFLLLDVVAFLLSSLTLAIYFTYKLLSTVVRLIPADRKLKAKVS